MLTSIIDFVKSPRLLLALALSTVSAALVAGPLAYRAIEVRANDPAAQVFDSTTVVPGDDLADVATTSPTVDEAQPTPTISIGQSTLDAADPADVAEEQANDLANSPDATRADSSSANQPQPDHDESSITILRDPPGSSTSDSDDAPASTTTTTEDPVVDDTTPDTTGTDNSAAGDDSVATTVPAEAEDDVEPTIVASSEPVESIGAGDSTTAPEPEVATPTEPGEVVATDPPAGDADGSADETTAAPADETAEVPSTLDPQLDTTSSTDSTLTDVTPTEPKAAESEASTGFAGSAGSAEDVEPPEVVGEDLDLSELVDSATTPDEVLSDEEDADSGTPPDEVPAIELGDNAERVGIEQLEQLEADVEASSVVAGSTLEPSVPDAELVPLVDDDVAAEPSYEAQPGAETDA